MNFVWTAEATAAEINTAKREGRNQGILGFVGMAAAVIVGVGMYLLWS